MAAGIQGYNTRLETYAVKIGSRWTTIRLEHEIMVALGDIARDFGLTVNELCTEIAIDRPEGSFTSALRVYIVSHYRRLLAGRGGPGPAARERASPHRTDGVRRRSLEVGERTASSELVSLYTWWKEQRTPGHLPSQDAINPDLFRRLGLSGLVHVVEVNAADPVNYRFRVFGRRVAEIGARDFAGCRIADHPGRHYRDAVAEDYFAAVTTGAPLLQEVDASVGTSRRLYHRLILPFSNDGSPKPDRLLVAVRYQSLAC